MTIYFDILTGSDLLAAAVGVCLFTWCALVVTSASRSDSLRQQRSMARLHRSLEGSLRDLHLRQKVN
ncbi:hypothetical protein [Belnapia sp. F-4-1]|uniref:hypothetical protein n=1 Tax=Belnapia sp. F-4-1 TaxID=1545443 RepID=UPI0005BAFB26|nr:hypothetical protein [Belnapia sp. F-4-1]